MEERYLYLWHRATQELKAYLIEAFGCNVKNREGSRPGI